MSFKTDSTFRLKICSCQLFFSLTSLLIPSAIFGFTRKKNIYIYRYVSITTHFCYRKRKSGPPRVVEGKAYVVQNTQRGGRVKTSESKGEGKKAFELSMSCVQKAKPLRAAEWLAGHTWARPQVSTELSGGGLLHTCASMSHRGIQLPTWRQGCPVSSVLWRAGWVARWGLARFFHGK